MEKKQRSSGRSEPFASLLYAEPGALGLTANIMSALVVAMENMVIGTGTTFTSVLSGIHLIVIGGFLQLCAGLMSFRRFDHLTGTAFTVFASLWTFQGIIYIFSGGVGIADLQTPVLPAIVGFIAIAISLFICSLFANFIMPPVLIAMVLTLVFEGVGLFYTWGRRAASAFELFIALTAIYAVVVMTTKGVSQRYILPGFGNAPIDPLLIQRKAIGNKKNEKRKNTKYAEPMGLGYLGNVIPSIVLCFYYFDYFTEVRPTLAVILCNSISHILAVYYAFLRRDFFHTIQFVAYFAFWTSKGLAPYILSFNAISVTGYFGSWGIVLILLLVTFLSTTQSMILFLYNIVLTVTAVLSVEHIPEEVIKYTFGVSSAISSVTTVYVATAHLLNSIAEKPILYVGPEVLSHEKLKGCFNRLTSRKTNEKAKGEQSKDILTIDCVAYLCNTVAAIALSPIDFVDLTASLPGILVAGVFLNLFCARFSYASSCMARSFFQTTLAVVWAGWSLYLFQGVDKTALQGASIGALCLFTVAVTMTTTFSKLWMVFSLTMECVVVALVAKSYDAEVKYMVFVTSLLAGLVGLYGTISCLLKDLVGKSVLPEGDPILQTNDDEPSPLPCPTFRSRITEDLREACRLLDNGDVIGVPTDTVYALAGSCKQPESVSKIYHIKGRPPEKPICLCISNLDQLRVANPPFSDLLWRFMDLCYPGGITCVVPKGNWLQKLGVGDAVEYVGTKDSLAIRVPDSSVLSYLVSLSGPIAITSANPSGEPDSTHHDMVIDSLGHKLAGVVCDDESNESVASTVVNCLKIDEGTISYFRIGCTPKEKVDAFFERAKREILTEE